MLFGGVSRKADVSPQGAPIDRDPTVDNLTDAKDVNKVNDFDYSDDLTAQARCPFTAHLRKVSNHAF